MSITVDASTPAMVNSVSTTQVSPSFSPPAATLLVALVNFQSAGSPATAITMSNTGTALTWTLRARRDRQESGAGIYQSNIVAIYTAPNLAAQTGITVTATSDFVGDVGALKVLVVNAANLSSPVGAVGEGSGTATTMNPTAYSSTVSGSRCVAVAGDFNGDGTLASTDTGFVFLNSGYTGGVALYKAADTGTPGTSVAVNFSKSGGTTPSWEWVAAEIVPTPPFSGRRVHVPTGAVHRASRW